VAGEKTRFAHARIGQETIGGFDRRPVLARIGNASPHTAVDITKQPPEPFSQTFIPEHTSRLLVLGPVAVVDVRFHREAASRSFDIRFSGRHLQFFTRMALLCTANFQEIE